MRKIESKNGPIWIVDEAIDLSLLPPQSNKKIAVVCPMCLKEYIAPIYTLYYKGHSRCQPCQQRIGAYGDLIGQRVGRITITGFGEPALVNSGGDRTTFIAACDCGNQTTVFAQSVKRSLRKGSVVSCGCYNLERIKQMGLSNAGENNPMYRRDLTEQEKRKLLKKRKLPGQITWRNKVKSRDKQCVICGSTKALEVHHLLDFLRNTSHRRAMGNGVTLCNQHHKDFHYRFLSNSHKPCTPETFYNYLATVHAWTIEQIDTLIQNKQLTRDGNTVAAGM